MDIEIVSRLSGTKKNKWIEFLSRAGLEADEGVQRTVLVWDGEELIATGSRQDGLLKCIAVDDSRQGEGLTATVYTQVSDVEQEVNGIMTYDRKVLKINQNTLRSIHNKLKFEE